MTIEKCIPQGEAVQSMDETQTEKKKLALSARYLVIAFLAFPGSFSLPVGCATYAYRQFKGPDQADSDNLKAKPVIHKVESGLVPSLRNFASAESQP